MKNTSVSKNKTFNVRGLILGLAVAGIFLHQDATAGQAPVDLGWAGSFAILSKSGITDVPTSAITGMLERVQSPVQLLQDWIVQK